MHARPLRKRLPFIAAIASAAAIGYLFGHNHGYHANDPFADDSPVIAVPSDYLAGLKPVAFVPNGSFSFDTFVFTDDQGREMAVPLPSIH